MAVNTAFDVDATVQKLVMTDNIKEKEALAREIQAQARSKGVFLASIHDVYKARGKGQGKSFTTPAMNLRSMTYYLARAIFRVATACETIAQAKQALRGDCGGAAIDGLKVIEDLGGLVEVIAESMELRSAGVPVGDAVGRGVLDIEVAGGARGLLHKGDGLAVAFERVE